MQKRNNQIRDLKIIENGLDNNFAGILSFNTNNENLLHLPIAFVYLDKNVYFFFNDDDEIYNNLPYDSNAIFTTIKSEKGKKLTETEFNPIYKFTSVTIKGIIKKVEEQKTIDDIRKRYVKKYSKPEEASNEKEYLQKLVFIDTEEIQAFEEIGG